MLRDLRADVRLDVDVSGDERLRLIERGELVVDIRQIPDAVRSIRLQCLHSINQFIYVCMYVCIYLFIG